MAKHGKEYLNSASKRGLDVLGALGIGAILSPAVIPSTVAAMIDNRSLNPLFKQERKGQGGRPINTIKLRTLHEARAADVHFRLADQGLGVSRTGVFLRRFGLDELPQLQAVVDGRMSLVGLRSRTQEMIQRQKEAAPDLGDEWEEIYLSGRPALISLSQLLARRRGLEDLDVRENLTIDIQYGRTASLTDDLKILGSTPLILLEGYIRFISQDKKTEAVTNPQESTAV